MNFVIKTLIKFILRKGVYPYEYMDNWERFDETSLPNKESFCSNLNMENIDDIDYRHGNNYLLMYLKTFEILVLKCINLIPLISYHYQN